ncbi:MAG: DUF885 domain-containing protein [Eubacteriales bacterium]|nr:DUF885 domain-containing protein [Eubacteriales bacterium]
MPKKRSIIALLLVSALLLILCCVESTRLFLNTDRKFEAFSNDLFCQEVSGNTITLHYTLQNPSNYGIDNPEISLGGYPVSSMEINAATENCLALLQAIPYQELNADNQTTYRVLEDSLQQTLDSAPYILYDEPLSPLTGTQAQLPVLLSEYQFYRAADVDTYLELLQALPEHFDSLIDFEQAKSDAGLFMASYTADAIIKECNTFLNMGSSNYLYSSFEDRIEKLEDCDDAAKDSYISQNEKALKEFVFPSYQKLISALTRLRETGKNPNGLCHLPDGASYYEYLVKRETGSERTIEELETLTKNQMREDLLIMQNVLTSPEYETLAETSGTPLPDFALQDSNPAAILIDLKGKLGDNFPAIPNVDTEVKYVQPEMEEYLSPAFYMVPAIDSTDSQTIYINSGHIPDDLDLYTTLAHEGYPGHLYQNVYYASTNPAPIRSLLGCGGYTEGWATYTEMMSYYFTSLPSEQASLLQHNASVLLGLYALADMGIHYEGWTLLDTVSFFHEYGISDTDVIEDIYDLIIADPANYLKYYVGYLEFLELKKEAINQWGEDFTQKRFHKAVLEAGTMPFYLLRETVLEK